MSKKKPLTKKNDVPKPKPTKQMKPAGPNKSALRVVKSGKPGQSRTKGGIDKIRGSELPKLPAGFSPDSAKTIKDKYKDKSGRVRLRGLNGAYLTSEAQDTILQIAALLDKEAKPYTYESLLSIPDVANKILVIEDKTPRDVFYWNAQNQLDIEEVLIKPKVGDKFINTRRYEVVDFKGRVLKTTSRETATEWVLKLSKKLDEVNGSLMTGTGKNPYLTVATYETQDSRGNVIKIKMDFSDVRGNIPHERIQAELEALTPIHKSTSIVWKRGRKKAKQAREKTKEAQAKKVIGIPAKKAEEQRPAGLISPKHPPEHTGKTIKTRQSKRKDVHPRKKRKGE